MRRSFGTRHGLAFLIAAFAVALGATAVTGAPLDARAEAVAERGAARRGANPIDPGARPVTAESAANGSSLLVYTPITPCRVFNTQLAAIPMTPGTDRPFWVSGTTGFEVQGGQAGGCGIPEGQATAVMINLVAKDAVGGGNFRIFAWDDPTPSAPAASALNYGAIGTNLANAIIAPLCNDATSINAGCDYDVFVRASFNTAHLIADVMGYFSAWPSALGVKVLALPYPPGVTSFCANLTSVTVQAPTTGRVVISGQIIVVVEHASGTADHIRFKTAVTSADCTTPPLEAQEGGYVSVGSFLPTGMYSENVTVHSVHSAAPGSNTYYVNVISTSGASALDDVGPEVSLSAVFHPD
jgi:hypothetical protein